MRETGLAIGLVVLAVVTLGTDWTGVEVAPGVWRDRVTPGQWTLFGAGVALVGVGAARLVSLWWRRLAILVPTLGWLAWQLQVGTLWPLALLVYGSGTLVIWTAACGLGDWFARPLSTRAPG